MSHTCTHCGPIFLVLVFMLISPVLCLSHKCHPGLRVYAVCFVKSLLASHCILHKGCPDTLTEKPQIVSLMFFSFTSLGKSKPNHTKVHVHADSANLRLHFPHILPVRGECGSTELFTLSLLTI